MKKRIGVVGGDRRQLELARLLRQDGWDAVTYGLSDWDENEVSLEETLETEILILPLPLCKETGILHCECAVIRTAEVFRELKPDQLVLAGQVYPQQREEARGLTLVDYFQREELAVANAAATAEASIRVAMERLDRMLLGMNCLVLGFGRIGKLTANRLHGLGANVTVAARKAEDLAWARAYGFSVLELKNLGGALGEFGIVFNTIPAMVLSGTLVEKLNPRCLCVDIASVPGIDFAKADECGIAHVWARALPGRMVPVSAAEIIRDTTYNIIKEREELV